MKDGISISWIFSKKELLLIVLGGIISAISLVLPFWTMQFLFLSMSRRIYQTQFLIPYVLILVILAILLILSYGKFHPELYLAIGMILLIVTVIASQIKAGTPSGEFIRLSIGFYLNICASVIIMIGGFFAYRKKNT